jgi:hypothetical protein
MLGIAVTNGRIVLALALLAWTASRLPVLRAAADIAAVAVVVPNALLVGCAVGAYGTAALPWLVHLPLEWTALAIPLALHLAGTRRPVTLAEAAVATLCALALVALGAGAETYLTPQP